MGLSWERGDQPPEMIADRPLYLDKTGDIVVEEGSPESASQLCGKGVAIYADHVARLGLYLDGAGKVQQRGYEVAAEPVVPLPADVPPAVEAKGPSGDVQHDASAAGELDPAP